MPQTSSIAAIAAAVLIGVTGCTASGAAAPAATGPATSTAAPSASSAGPAPATAGVPLSRLGHIHSIAGEADGGILIASHAGIYRLADSGAIEGPIGGNDFDAMGFTVAGEAFFASGHPGPRTPPELGSPHLGIVRSDDGGESWSPVAYTSQADFHVLTAAPDGTLHGITTSAPQLLSSSDAGVNWRPVSSLSAADLVATDAALVAATERGLQASDDGGATFAPVEGAPLLYSIDALADGSVVGIDTDGVVQRQSGDDGWVQLGSVVGTASAVGVVGDDRILIADDRGIVELGVDGEVVLSPAG